MESRRRPDPPRLRADLHRRRRRPRPLRRSRRGRATRQVHARAVAGSPLQSRGVPRLRQRSLGAGEDDAAEHTQEARRSAGPRCHDLRHRHPGGRIRPCRGRQTARASLGWASTVSGGAPTISDPPARLGEAARRFPGDVAGGGCRHPLLARPARPPGRGPESASRGVHPHQERDTSAPGGGTVGCGPCGSHRARAGEGAGAPRAPQAQTPQTLGRQTPRGPICRMGGEGQPGRRGDARGRPSPHALGRDRDQGRGEGPPPARWRDLDQSQSIPAMAPGTRLAPNRTCRARNRCGQSIILGAHRRHRRVAAMAGHLCLRRGERPTVGRHTRRLGIQGRARGVRRPGSDTRDRDSLRPLGTDPGRSGVDGRRAVGGRRPPGLQGAGTRRRAVGRFRA